MDKRVEIYIGFKCNNDCVFCVERNSRLKNRDKILYHNLTEIEDKIKSLKNQGYNHLNFLGGEPFLEKIFLPFLQTAKKYGFSTAVTTNGSMLAIEEIAQSHLPLINDLIVSIHGHTEELIVKQTNNSRLFTGLKNVFINIKKYFKGRLLKANCVINKLNYNNLKEIVKFIHANGISEISLTNMSIKGYNNDYIVPLSEIKKIIPEIADYAKENNLIIRFSDLPFCILGDNYFLTNEIFADERVKLNAENKEESFWRPKIKTEKCNECKLKDLCLGLDLEYYKLFGDGELEPVI
ncbi:MAG: radical SAM protein [Candidatus Parcubacteria bacterium]|nr:radical SAM protein [Candidatus Parcubacteria bacterium]